MELNLLLNSIAASLSSGFVIDKKSVSFFLLIMKIGSEMVSLALIIQTITHAWQIIKNRNHLNLIKSYFQVKLTLSSFSNSYLTSL